MRIWNRGNGNKPSETQTHIYTDEEIELVILWAWVSFLHHLAHANYMVVLEKILIFSWFGELPIFHVVL